MKAWRIQYYEHGVTFDKVREASLYCERIQDAETIGKIFAKVATWQDWKKAVAAVQKSFRGKTAQGFIYAIERGQYIPIAVLPRPIFPAP
jgi:hypothetical protein